MLVGNLKQPAIIIDNDIKIKHARWFTGDGILSERASAKVYLHLFYMYLCLLDACACMSTCLNVHYSTSNV